MELADFLATLQTRIRLVEDRVAAACRRAGRDRNDITIVAVTKTLSLEAVRHVPELGLTHLGENRPQELWRRAAAMPDATWHFIGHLQRNKVDKTLATNALIHAVDSLRLLQALDDEARQQNRISTALLEINASGEATKQGFSPAEALALIPQLTTFKNLNLRGLMTMAAPLDDPEQCRPTFATLRKLRDQFREQLADVRELSMGMSNDFEIAIEEGASLVRLGSVYFDGLESN